MKVFRLNEYEWWAAEDFEAAIEECLKCTGMKREEAVDDEAHELTEQEMQLLIFTDDDDTKRTFAEQLKHLEGSSETFPCLFATTEW